MNTETREDTADYGYFVERSGRLDMMLEICRSIARSLDLHSSETNDGVVHDLGSQLEAAIRWAKNPTTMETRA